MPDPAQYLTTGCRQLVRGAGREMLPLIFFGILLLTAHERERTGGNSLRLKTGMDLEMES